MTTQSTSLVVQPRTVLGKKVKGLRKGGLTPIHLYGPGVPSLALQADTRVLRRTLTQVGRSRPLSLQIGDGGEQCLAFVRDIQFHPVSSEILHVDLLRVDVGLVTRVEVPLELQGEAPAARVRGGNLFQAVHSILVEAKPLDIPEVIIVDISGLDDFEKAIRIADIPLPPGVTPLTDPDQVIAHVTPPVAAPEAEAEAAHAAEPERVAQPRVEVEQEDGTEGEGD
jgi:large subunit ribosomal protein L25